MKKAFSLLCLLFFSYNTFSQELEVIDLVVEVGCEGDCNGYFEVYVTGGVAPYQYSIDGSAYQNSNTFDSLCAGVYTINVVDAEGTLAIGTVTISEPVPLLVVIEFTDSGNEPSGVIETYATGGRPPYVYAIDSSAYQSQNIFSDLQGGVYEVTVQDSYGCIYTSNVIIINAINIDNTLIVDGNTLSTNIEADTYQWINADTQTSISGETNRTFTASQVGNYRVEMIVTVSDTADKSSKTKSGQINVSSPTYNVSSILSSSNNSLDNLKLYPNPATSYLKLPIVSINKNYIIYNTLGEKIVSGKLVNQELSISNLSKGIYFLNVEDYSTTKFIKM